MFFVRMLSPAIHEPALPGTLPDWELGSGVYLFVASDQTARLIDLNGLVAVLESASTSILLAHLTVPEIEARGQLVHKFRLPADEPAARINLVLEKLSTQHFIRRRSDGSRSGGVIRNIITALLIFVLKTAAIFFRTAHWTARLGIVLVFFTIRLAGLGRAIELIGHCFPVVDKPDSKEPVSDIPMTVSRRLQLSLPDIRELIQQAAARSWLPITCKERALVAYIMVSRSGRAGAIELGVDPHPFRSHLWCTADGEIVSEPEHSAECIGLSTLTVFPPPPSGRIAVGTA